MPSIHPRNRPLVTLSVLALALLATGAKAQTMVRNEDAGFKIAKRSIWQNGRFYGQDSFYGFRWNGSGKFGDIVALDVPPVDFGLFTVPGYSLGATGAKFDYDMDVNLGLRGYAGAFGGDLTADYSANLTYSYPLYIRAGETFPVTVTYRTTPNAHFDTTSPQYRAGVDLVADLSASLTGSAKFLGLDVFDDATILGESIGKNGVSRLNYGGTYPIIGVSDLTQSNLPGLLGQFTPVGMSISVPETPTHGIYENGGLALTGTKYSPFVSFDTTLIGLLALAAGGAGDAIDFTAKDYTINAGPTNLALSWKIASFNAQQSYGFAQSVKLSDAPVVTLIAGTQVASHTFTKDNESFTYTLRMPASGPLGLQTLVTHYPKLDNLVTTGTSGSIAFTPFALSFKGNLGSGPQAKNFDFSGKVDEKDLSSGTGAIQEVAHEVTEFKDADVIKAPTRDFQINPFDDRNPAPAAAWQGDRYTTVTGKVPYAQPPAYNGYTRFSGGIDAFEAYRLTLVPQDTPEHTTAFSGFDPSDLNRMRVVVEAWDGRSPADLPNDTGSRLKVVQMGPSSINVDLPAALLRPGRHTLSLVLTASFQGALKTLKYSVPVLVRVPAPAIRSQIWNRIDLGESGGGFVINRFAYNTGTGTFWFKADGALLETEVVLDESIVLPSKKYVQLGSGGGPVTVTSDANLAYSDEDELRYFTSGNAIMEFTLPAELNKRLNGGIHTLRLRTKDVQGTRIDGDPANAGDTYRLSALPGASQDVPDTRLYFWSKQPTVASVRYQDSATVPETPGPVRLTLKGTEFTPTARVRLKANNSTYDLPVEFGDDRTLYADLTPTALFALAKSGHQGTLTLSTPTMLIPNPTLDDPLYAGGTATKALTSTPLTPAIDAITPAPVRDQAVTLDVTGRGFAFDGFQAGTSEVSLDGTILPTSAIRFVPFKSGRDLKRLTADVPASLLSRAGKKRLRVVNHGPNGVDLIGAFDLTVSNAKPILAAETLSVVADDATTPTVTLAGGAFYKDATTALVGGSAAASSVVDAGHLRVALPADRLKAASTSVSVLNAAPGGGQSAEKPITVYEGNVATLQLVPGARVFDRASGDYRQSFSVTYTGTRNVSRGALLHFLNLSGGWTLANLSGVDANARAYLATGLVPRRQVTVVAVFHNILPTLRLPLDSTATVGLNN